jgi:hypothetical protein
MPNYIFKCDVLDCPEEVLYFTFADFDKAKDLQVCSCCSASMHVVTQPVGTIVSRGDREFSTTRKYIEEREAEERAQHRRDKNKLIESAHEYLRQDREGGG